MKALKQFKNLKKLYRKGCGGILTVVICSSMFSVPTIADVEERNGYFLDVPKTASYAEAVNTLAEIGIVSGDTNGKFNPDNTITRAETATIICSMMGVADEAKTMKKSVFTDVPASHWASGYIAKAVDMGIISGYGNGKFGPGDPVTYEQVVKMIVSAWGYTEFAKERGGYPKGYVELAKELGISNKVVISKNSALRCDVAQLCYNALFVNEHFE